MGAYVGQVVDGGGGSADLAPADGYALTARVVQLDAVEAHIVAVPPCGRDDDLQSVPARQQGGLEALRQHSVNHVERSRSAPGGNPSRRPFLQEVCSKTLLVTDKITRLPEAASSSPSPYTGLSDARSLHRFLCDHIPSLLMDIVPSNRRGMFCVYLSCHEPHRFVDVWICTAHHQVDPHG